MLPKVHLSQRLQELCANKPIRGVPQSQQVYHQLQAELTHGAAAHRHYAVLKDTNKKLRLTKTHSTQTTDICPDIASYSHCRARHLAGDRRFILESFLQQRHQVHQGQRVTWRGTGQTGEKGNIKYYPSFHHVCATAHLYKYTLLTHTHKQTCCTPHTGQPGVYVVTCFGEYSLYDGSTEDGCGPSDLWVSVVNEAQHVTNILLLCKDTEKTWSKTELKSHEDILQLLQ